MIDGRYRRALSSMPGRAAHAPRWFDSRHDVQIIPEVELALVVGEALTRTARMLSAGPPPGQPPFQDWYRALISVPYFDYPAGGIPVAVIQLVSSEESLATGQTPEVPLGQLRTLLREAVSGAVRLLRQASTGRIMDEA
jgi:hypothetical protein